jgi:head-to-tail connecting protein
MWMETNIAETGGFGGLKFRTLPPGKYVLTEEFDGGVKTINREFSLPVRVVADKWPTRISEKLKNIVATKPDDLVPILHTFQPLAGGSSDRQHYESRYFEKDSKQELQATAYRNFRYLVPRWDKASDEEYGTGQGDVAYPDTASLNRAVEMRFKQWAKAIDPPILTVDDGVIGKINMTAGRRTVVRSLDAVKEFQTTARFDVAQFNEEQLRQMIRNAFFADQLQLPNKPYMTAFEIQSLLEIMQRLLGPQLGRLKEEYARPLLTFVFEEMWQAGAIPPPPPLVVEAQQAGLASIDVEYESPLTKVQRTSSSVAIEKTLQQSAGLLAIDPNVGDNLDTDQTFRTLAEVNGVPSKNLRSLDARDQIRDSRSQAEAERAQAELGQLKSGNIKNVAQAAAAVTPKEGAAPPA